MKKYRLLRSNKETGPYTAEELIQSGLKAYDLIWVDGKSAAWRYPSEIEEFKNFAPGVEEQPFDRFFKRNSSATITSETAVTTTVIKKDKPRIRVKADSRKIETSVVMAQPAQVFNEVIAKPASYTNNTTTQPAVTTKREHHTSWESMWSDWEEEKKAVSRASKKEQPAEEVLETKYTQSLDDIKEQYIQTVLKQKKSDFNFEKNKNQIAVAVLVIAILGTGIWMGLNWSNSSDNSKITPVEVANIEPQPADQNNNNNQVGVEKSSPVINENTTATNETPAPVATTTAEPVSNTNTTVAKPKTPVKSTTKTTVYKIPNKTGATTKTVPAPVQQNTNTVTAKTVGYTPTVVENGVRTAAKRTDVVNNTNTTTELAPNQNNTVAEKPKQRKRDADISDYVAVDTYKPFANAVGVQYKVSDVSDVPLDLVVIDLLYYNNYNTFLKGETMYVRNIQPGETVNVSAPDNEKATKINYKVSIVSSERNDLYLIGE